MILCVEDNFDMVKLEMSDLNGRYTICDYH